MLSSFLVVYNMVVEWGALYQEVVMIGRSRAMGNASTSRRQATNTLAGLSIQFSYFRVDICLFIYSERCRCPSFRLRPSTRPVTLVVVLPLPPRTPFPSTAPIHHSIAQFHRFSASMPHSDIPHVHLVGSSGLRLATLGSTCSLAC